MRALIPKQVRTLLALACLSVVVVAAAWSGNSVQLDDPRLKPAEARTYLLELINRDRAALGLKPVALDPVATKMAQEQSDRMVTLGDISHADLDGRLPPQRYTEAGGRDRVRENVVVYSVQESLERPIELDPDPTFSREEVEAIQAAYFNEVPPNDGHRRNILRREHTHVGIGFARGVGEFAWTIGNAQEFVDRYVEDLAPVPARARTGEQVTVSGRLTGGRRLVAVGLSRGPLPKRLSRSAYQEIVKYSPPAPYVKYRADEKADGVRIVAQPDGRFEAALRLDDWGRPGLYYVSVWVRDPEMGEVLASQRTVIVEQGANPDASVPKGNP